MQQAAAAVAAFTFFPFVLADVALVAEPLAPHHLCHRQAEVGVPTRN
jgi:hypothetical protein